MKTKLILLGLCLMTTLNAAEVDAKLLKAIHLVESSGRLGAIKGDHGLALGPLQIHREYFLDAASFDPSLGRNYNNVTNLAFAKRVVSAYLKKYAPKAVKTNNIEVLARVHNGGPNGYRTSATVEYWRKIRKALIG